MSRAPSPEAGVCSDGCVDKSDGTGQACDYPTRSVVGGDRSMSGANSPTLHTSRQALRLGVDLARGSTPLGKGEISRSDRGDPKQPGLLDRGERLPGNVGQLHWPRPNRFSASLRSMPSMAVAAPELAGPSGWGSITGAPHRAGLAGRRSADLRVDQRLCRMGFRLWAQDAPDSIVGRVAPEWSPGVPGPCAAATSRTASNAPPRRPQRRRRPPRWPFGRRWRTTYP